MLCHVCGAGAGSNQLVLGGDVGVTPIIGRHGTADLHIGKRTGIALGWAASKGWYAGAAAQAGIIRTRGDVNKKFYGKEVRRRSTRPIHIPHSVWLYAQTIAQDALVSFDVFSCVVSSCRWTPRTCCTAR